jgi:hypothetical protein
MSGGGWIPASAGDKATFGFVVAVQSDGTVTGHLVYADQSVGLRLRSTAITSVASAACTSTFTGVGESNFGPVDFVVTASDNGEPGSVDTFAIEVSLGYAAAGVLGGGDIKAHGQTCPS